MKEDNKPIDLELYIKQVKEYKNKIKNIQKEND